MVDVAARHPRLNLLNLEAVALAHFLSGTVWLSEESAAGILPAILGGEGIAWNTVAIGDHPRIHPRITGRQGWSRSSRRRRRPGGTTCDALSGRLTSRRSWVRNPQRPRYKPWSERLFCGPGLLRPSKNRRHPVGAMGAMWVRRDAPYTSEIARCRSFGTSRTAVEFWCRRTRRLSLRRETG